MSVTLEIEKKVTIDIEVYDVLIGGEEINFDGWLDSDGDIRIELDERDFETVAIKYLRAINTDDELKDLFGLED